MLNETDQEQKVRKGTGSKLGQGGAGDVGLGISEITQTQKVQEYDGNEERARP